MSSQDLVYVVDDQMKKSQLEAAGVRTCICTDGLLEDIPPANEALGIEITEDFRLVEQERPKTEKVLRQLLRYQASRLVVVTSPSDEGIRIADQVRRKMGLLDNAEIHSAGPIILQPDNISGRQRVHPGRLAQAQTRRVIDRLAGFMLTEHLQWYATRAKIALPRAMDRYTAAILCTLYGWEHKAKQYHVGLEHTNRCLLRCTSAGPNEEPAKMLPTLFDLAGAEQQRTRLRNLGGVVTLVKKVVVPDMLEPAKPLTVFRLAALCQEQDLGTFQSMLQGLTKLYNLGLITHYLPHQADYLQPLNETLHQIFLRNNVGSAFRGLTARRGTIFPTGKMTPDEMFAGSSSISAYTSVVALYRCIYDRAMDAARTPVQIVKDVHVFSLGPQYLVANRAQPLNRDMVRAGFSLPPSPEYISGGAGVVVARATNNSLADFLQQFDGLACSTQLLTSLNNLVASGQLLTLDAAGQLSLTPEGQTCVSILKDQYPDCIDLDELRAVEKALVAIGAGREHPAYFLRMWYHRFRVRDLKSKG